MKAFESAKVAARLRAAPRRSAKHAVDAEVFAAPRFWLLVLLAALAVLAQSTILHSLTLRDAHLSLVTVLVVWTGLRCGVVAGGWLGLFGGFLEDALGGAGGNVLSGALAGFAAGLLSNRFFSDSLPIFVIAVAAATFFLGTVSYVVMDVAFGEHGMFVRTEHALAWQALLNCSAAIVVLLWLRLRENVRRVAR